MHCIVAVFLLLLTFANSATAYCEADPQLYIVSSGFDSNSGQDVTFFSITIVNNGSCSIGEMYAPLNVPVQHTSNNYDPDDGFVTLSSSQSLVLTTSATVTVTGIAMTSPSSLLLENLTLLCAGCTARPIPTPVPTPAPTPAPTPTPPTAADMDNNRSASYGYDYGYGSFDPSCPTDGICSNATCWQTCAGNPNKFKCPAAYQGVFTSGIPQGSDMFTTLLNRTMETFIPGSEHLAQGINVVTGEETGHAIIVLRYCSGNPDSAQRIDYAYRGNRYRVPDSLVAIAQPLCSLDSSSKMYSYSSEVANEMSAATNLKVSVEGNLDLPKVKLAGSASYSKDTTVELAGKMTKSGKTSLAITEAKCQTNHFEWSTTLDESFGYANLHPQFEMDLNNMASVSDAVLLVEKYGTHFYQSAGLGGKLQQLTSISETFMQEHSESAVAEKIEASFSASVSGGYGPVSGSASAEGSISTDGQFENVSDTDFTSNTQSSSVRSFGGAPFNVIDSDWATWAESIDTLPVAIDYQLMEILQILPDIYNVRGVSIRATWSAAVLNYLSGFGVSYPATYQMSASSSYQLTSSGKVSQIARGFGLQLATYYETRTFRPSSPSYVEPYSFIPFPRSNNYPALIASTGQDNQIYLDFKGDMPVWDVVHPLSNSQLLAAINSNFPTAYADPYSTVPAGLVDHFSISYSPIAKEYAYYPPTLYRTPFPLIVPDGSTYYRVARWYYEVKLDMGNNPCVIGNKVAGQTIFASTSPDALLFDEYMKVTLTGTSNTVTGYIDDNQVLTCGVLGLNIFKLQIYSHEYVGQINAVSVRVLSPSSVFYFAFDNVTVIDLDDNVYLSRNLDPLVLRSPGDQTLSFTTSVYPMASYPDPQLLYGYMLGIPTSFMNAQAQCSALGGVVVSGAQISAIAAAGADWCGSPAWYSDSYFDYYDYKCKNIYLAQGSVCGGGNGIVDKVGYDDSGIPSYAGGSITGAQFPCSVVCYGPKPSDGALHKIGQSIINSVLLALDNDNIVPNFNSSSNSSSPGIPLDAGKRSLRRASDTPSPTAAPALPTYYTSVHYDVPLENKCALPSSTSYQNQLQVALASPAFGSFLMCGACLNVTVYGKWGGVVTQYTAIVVDECETCTSDANSLAVQSNGTNDNMEQYISWNVVSCDRSSMSNNGAFQYYIHPLSTWSSLTFQVYNTIIPVSSVSVIQKGGKSTVLTRSENWWTLTSTFYPPTFPLTLNITSISGQTVTDVIHANVLGTPINGAAQFTQ